MSQLYDLALTQRKSRLFASPDDLMLHGYGGVCRSGNTKEGNSKETAMTGINGQIQARTQVYLHQPALFLG